MVEIPERLQDASFRFIKLKPGLKVPFEADWQKTANYLYYDRDFKAHIGDGNNYGILGGFGNLVIVDCDQDKVAEAVREGLPETFTVKTGSGKWHFYYKCLDMDKPIRLTDQTQGDLGDVQWKGKQCVGPNSIHPNGQPYVVERDVPLAEIKAEQLRFALREFMPVDFPKEMPKSDTELDIAKVVPLGGLHQRGHEWQGPHPLHGSEGGQNFTVDVEKGVWHCFRHGTGGNAWHWLAMENKILDCSDCMKGSLTGDNFKQVLSIARERYGLKTEKEEPIVEKLPVVYYGDLRNMTFPEQKWLVDRLVPMNAISVLAGKRSTYKSFVAMHIALCIATGGNVFGKWPANKGRVLYIDEENRLEITWKRLQGLVEGHGMKLSEEEYGNIAILSRKGFKVDSEKWKRKLTDFIEAYKPDLIIFDTLRRVHSKPEDSADDINALFTDHINPIVNGTNVALLIIHHVRKGKQGAPSSGDLMDEMRGSSEFANIPESVLVLAKNPKLPNKLTLHQPKCRPFLEIESESIGIDSNESFTTMRMFAEGTAVEEMTKVSLCTKLIIKWVIEGHLTDFRRKEALARFTYDYTQATITRALKECIERGFLANDDKTKGKYLVIRENLKDFEGETNDDSTTQPNK